MTRDVAILIFPEVELLDFCGPYEVFAVAGREGTPPPVRVFTVAKEKGPILTRRGFDVLPQRTLAEMEAPHVVVIPGGQGARAAMLDEEILGWVRRTAARAEIVLSVCTGALILAKAGLLDGLAATTHHTVLEGLRDLAPRTEVRTGVRYVDNGQLITAAGIAAGIDGALHVIRRLLGTDHAHRTAQYMEYPWADGA
ncbi:MAG TPA: DJ-1/PfpI family protein [Gemmatales bacterium]|nr:DJ-1/PfpI family protein [Gemmatales bacterium]HMP60139.1 DJ-1/PfpI family protein [Gemmatales bacterium]